MFVYNEEKYNALHSIIDFFSQNLHLDQIVEYGFNIYNSLEMPLSSSIFVLNAATNHYERKFTYGSASNAQPCLQIEKAYNHDTFAVRNGFFLMNREIQERYFSSQVLDTCEVGSVMPLIIDDLLYGFIFTTHEKPDTSMGEAFLSRFNFLMNLSLEKASRYVERELLRKEIDKRIFNLATLSHTVKLLLSELSLEGLMRLAVDVIQETCSNCTAAIGLMDSTEQYIKVESFSTVHSFSKNYEQFTLKNLNEAIPKNLLSVENDGEILEMIFEDVHKFNEIGAKYVVLLKNEGIQGILLISQKTQMALTQDIKDRFSDVAGILTIGVRNAKQFQLINEQKEALDKNIKVMNRMNALLKDINSSESLDELMDQMMDMIHLTFGVESAFLMDETGIVKQSGEMESITLEGIESEVFESLYAHEIETYYTRASALMDYPWLELLNSRMNCLIIVPIRVSQYSDDVLMHLVVTQTKKRLHESQVTMLELLSNSVAPIMQQLKQVAYYQTHYIENPVEKLKRLHQLYMSDYVAYGISYKVYLMQSNGKPFGKTALEEMYPFQTIGLNGYVVFFSCEDVAEAFLMEGTWVENPSWEDLETFLS